MAKISDVAKRAGVSETAVSFALNNKPGVSEETRKRIIDVARELEFKPKRRAARGTSKKRIGFLQVVNHGKIVNRDHDAFISDYIYGIHQACKTNGFEIGLMEQTASNRDAVTQVAQEAYDGLVVLGTELSVEGIREFDWLDLPHIFLDTIYPHINRSFITMNNNDAVFEILTYLRSRGLEAFEFVSSDCVCANIAERAQSFVETMTALGHVNAPNLVHKAPSTFTGAYQWMAAHLSRRTALPDAFVCANDAIALGCMRAIRESGLSIPGDIAVTGFDDLPVSAMADPGLTTFRVPTRQIGALGTGIILEFIKHDPKSITSIKSRVNGKLVVRSSTP